MEAYAAIGCTDATTGKQGSFLYQQQNEEGLLIAITPVFSHCIALFNWCRENQWKSKGVHDSNHPMGVYQKDLEAV